MQPKKINWLGIVAILVAMIPCLHAFMTTPAAPDPNGRRPALRVVDWAAWLWAVPLRRGDDVPAETDTANSGEDCDDCDEQERRMSATPHQHVADNQPPLRAMSVEGEPILDHGHGW